MDERRANYPFAEQYQRTMYENGRPGTPERFNQYGLDVPRDETVAYTQFGDPLAMFLSGKPTPDPLQMFIGFPKSR
jgi:hypothetical protein